jgi:flagellar biosynthesis protein FlhA
MSTANTTKSGQAGLLLPLQNMFRSKDMVMALSVMIIIMLMIVPVPEFIVDVLLVFGFAISIGIMLITMYISQPTEFFAFPTVLLLVTLLRLAMNIAVSRLILLNGSAGQVVATFGNIVMGSNYVVGVVIFLMIMIIQFVVINSGASRVAEVAARFTLDAMPGKQMAIDADLNAGLIDETMAKQRRKSIETEADFYGAMDGASKFVRGDAIAAIIIMLVNIIGGFMIGVVQKGTPMEQALQTYVLLTVGAGLAIQIPALLVSASAGLIVTRSTSEASLGTELSGQLANFNVLALTAILVGAMTFVPGLPPFPFVLISVSLGGLAYYVNRLKMREQARGVVEEPVKSAEPETPEQMLSMVAIDPLEMEIGYGLIPLIESSDQDNLMRRITGIRRQIMAEMGLVLPVVHIRDNLRLTPQAYRIKIRGQEVAGGELLLDQLLAIPGSSTTDAVNGIPTTEPAFGLPALWITEAEHHQAEMKGYTVVTPFSVLGTHLTEVVRANAGELLDRQMVQDMLNQLRQKSPALVDGVVPDLISLGEVQNLLRILLRERLPIRDLGGILEVLANHASITRDPNILSEAVRQNMARTISNLNRDADKILHVFTISPQMDGYLRSSLAPVENGPGFQIDANTAQKVLMKVGEQMERLAEAGYPPVLLCPRELRLALRRLLEVSLPNLVIMAYSEVSQGTRVKAHGMVQME